MKTQTLVVLGIVLTSGCMSVEHSRRQLVTLPSGQTVVRSSMAGAGMATPGQYADVVAADAQAGYLEDAGYATRRYADAFAPVYGTYLNAMQSGNRGDDDLREDVKATRVAAETSQKGLQAFADTVITLAGGAPPAEAPKADDAAKKPEAKTAPTAKGKAEKSAQPDAVPVSTAPAPAPARTFAFTGLLQTAGNNEDLIRALEMAKAEMPNHASYIDQLLAELAPGKPASDVKHFAGTKQVIETALKTISR